MRSKGFTLVELLIVVGLVLIIGTVGTSIITSVLRSYNKAHIINEIEQNGNYALSLMESQIRNARSVYPTSGTTQTLRVTPQEGEDFTFEIAGGVVRKGSEILTNNDPNSGVEVVAADSNFTISGTSPQTVTIVLKLRQATSITRIDYQAETTLRTTVVVRGGYE